MPIPSALRRSIEDFITDARCTATLVDLVKIPSPQTDLLEDEPRLRAFNAEVVAPRLRAMGIADVRSDRMGNVIAAFGADVASPSLLFVAHAMNQPQGTMAAAYLGNVEDGAPHGLPGRVVLGRGASEQKATLAAMLIAIEAVARSGIGLSGRLLFACCTSGESGKHDALRCVVEEVGVRADMAVLSGDSLTLSLGNRGRIDVVVTVEGRAAHSSSPHTGCNAVTGMIDVIRKVGEQVRLDAIHPDLGRPTLAVTRIRSYPESTHTIQARCDVTFDRRLLPGEDPHAAFSAIAAAAAMVDGTPDPVSGIAYRVRTELGPFMYPSLLAPDAPAVVRLVAAVEEALGQRPQTHFAAYAFDQGYLNHVGIPAVNWGPGEYAFAHTDLDMASVERTRDAALAYALLIVRELT